MFCANLHIYDQATDEVVDRVLFTIDDVSIEKVLQHLESQRGAVNLVVDVPNQETASVQVFLKWEADKGAFQARVDGRPAGYVFFDELKGALRAPVPTHFRTCMLNLSSDIDIWRRGVVDLENGHVQPYASAALGDQKVKATAHFFMGDSASVRSTDSFSARLTRGVQNASFYLSDLDLQRLRTQVYGRSFNVEQVDSERAFKGLRSLLDQLNAEPSSPSTTASAGPRIGH